MKRALITGIGGQDGSYLADILLERGYEVHGLHRRSSVDNLKRIAQVRDRINLHRGDVTDYGSVLEAVSASDPDEVYHEADQDDVRWSHDTPQVSIDVTVGGTSNVLQAVRTHNPLTKVFIPCSATMFGEPQDFPQTETTPLDPRSPYACAKAHAYHLARHYRRYYKMQVWTAILYNHDSPWRGGGYLLQRICRAAVQAKLAIGTNLGYEQLALTNLDMMVDIGYARDYMVQAHRMLQSTSAPDDYVFSHWNMATIRRLVDVAFGYLGLDWAEYVDVSEGHNQVGFNLLGDSMKAQEAFGFHPETSVVDLVKMIVDGVRKEYQE